MELRQLRYFVAVADQRNFTRAARSLHMSQPPLSRGISLLERELSVQLIDRSGKRFSLTEAGDYLYEEASRILEEVDACIHRTRLFGESAKGSLRIAAAGSLMLSVVPAIIAATERPSGFPRIELLEMSTENQAKAVLSGKVDLGFLRDWADSSGFVFEALGRESLAAIFPRTWAEAGQAIKSLADLSGKPFISGHISQAPGLAETTQDLCSEAGFSPLAAFECDHLPAMLKFVEAGLGWAIVPLAMARNDDALGVLELEAGLSFGMAYAPLRLPKSVQSLLETARRLFA
jgi:DNA-binding transcriptional LysR family regulator